MWFEPFLADLLVREAKAVLREQPWDFIVPVPLHPLKHREREFNQAERLASHLSAATGIPLNNKLLRRITPTATQTLLTREQRATNMRGAFAANPITPVWTASGSSSWTTCSRPARPPAPAPRRCEPPARAMFASGRLRAGFEFNTICTFMDTTSFTKKPLGGETIEPALTPPPVDTTQTAFTKKPQGWPPAKPRNATSRKAFGLKCPTCEAMIFDKELDENLKVCPKCGHHFPIGARERIHSLVETCTFEEMDAAMTSVDMLRFKGASTYKSKLEHYQKNTMLKDAVVTGIGKIGPHRLALGVMDFGFLGGSMGSVVGEKLTRLIERATEKEMPVVIISTSGGARMYEGMFSLMQMAKTSAALAYHAQAPPALHQRAHASDHGGRDGELRRRSAI